MISADVAAKGFSLSEERELSQSQFMAISRALSDPRRFSILQDVAKAPDALPCCSLTQMAEVSAATISHHIKELENAGLISIAREGKFAHLRFQRGVYETYLKKLSKI